MFLTTLGIPEVIALVALVIGVIATIATIVVIHNAKLKYGLLISLIIIVIISIVVLWKVTRPTTPVKPPQQESSGSQPDRPTQEGKVSPRAGHPGSSKPSASGNAASAPKYLVTLLIPSQMSGADVLVDGKTAAYVERLPTIVKIEVEQKNRPTRILIRKGAQECSQELLIRQDMNVSPCE